jgi:hypothetical protein
MFNTDYVKFGEVANAPPQLSKVTKTKNSSLLLADKLKNKNPGLKAQQDLAEERQKAIEMYRQIKKIKRTKN